MDYHNPLFEILLTSQYKGGTDDFGYCSHGNVMEIKMEEIIHQLITSGNYEAL